MVHTCWIFSCKMLQTFLVFLAFFHGCVCMEADRGTGAAAKPRAASECPGLKQDETCCGGRPYPKDMDRMCCRLVGSENEKSYVLRNKCANGLAEENAQFEDCGLNRFDHRFQDCCAGRQRYERNKAKCCIGRENSTAIPLDSDCCNGKALSRDEMCCQTIFDEIPVKKDHQSHTKCCVHPGNTSSVTTYNPSGQTCLDGQLSRRHRSRTFAPPPRTQGPQGPPRYDELCLQAKGVREEDGEPLKCCGPEPYRPSQKTCCRGLLHNISSTDSVCCYDEAFPRTSPDSNPCMRVCRGKSLNVENQMCCEGRIFNVTNNRQKCCGKSLMDSAKEHCCGNMPLDKKHLACCQQSWPYYPKLMTCNPRTKKMKLKIKKLRAQDLAKKFCTKKLDKWGEHWRSLILPGLLQLQGRVERCGIRVNQTSITILLAPAITRVGGASVSNCLKRRRLKLTLQLPKNRSCITQREAKHYLRDKTVDIYIAMDKLRCGKKGASLRLQNGDIAVVLISRRMDTMLVESSLSVDV